MQQERIYLRVYCRHHHCLLLRFIHLINKCQSIGSWAKAWLSMSAELWRKDRLELTRRPGGDVGIGVDLHVSFNVVLCGHIWGVTAEGTGSVASLIHTHIVDSEVVGELQMGPVDKLEVVGLFISSCQIA
jgi:hypothetical protein